MPEKILIIDDDYDSRLLLIRTLRKADYEVAEAGDGKQGLAFAFDLLPDLILLDILMPELDGYQVCQILKKDPRTSDIPVIFLSSMTDTKDKIKGLEIGGVDFIVKPFDQNEVLARVQTQLRNRQLMKEMLDKQKRLEEDLRVTTQEGEAVVSTKIISFVGCKGGVGTSFIGANLAYLLSQERKGQVLLVDLDLQYGQMVFFFDVKPQHTLSDVINHLDEIDHSYLKSLFYPYNNFLSLLPAPANLEEAETVSLEHLEKILLYFKNMQFFRWIFVDAGHHMDEITLRVMELTDMLVLVTAPSVPALTNTKKWLELLQLLNWERPLEIWLNSWSKNADLTISEISNYLGANLNAYFLFDPESVNQSINEGKPLAETNSRHRLCQALQIKAKELIGKEETKEAAASGWSWLKRLGKF